MTTRMSSFQLDGFFFLLADIPFDEDGVNDFEVDGVSIASIGFDVDGASAAIVSTFAVIGLSRTLVAPTPFTISNLKGVCSAEGDET